MRKPPTCAGCPLEVRGQGFAPPDGPPEALICFVGEALGADEVVASRPFVGPAGRKLNSSIVRLGLQREQVRVGNVISCRPPDNRLVGSPWEQAAIHHCRPHRAPLEGHRVYVTLGVTATRTLLAEKQAEAYSGRIENWRGYVIPCPDGSYVVPTYHPSHIIQGQQRLTGVFLYDIKRAMEVASFGYEPDQVSLVQDPPLQWFEEWASLVDEYCWLSCDIETPMKQELQEDDLDAPVGTITRINFSFHPDQGVTVPWDPRYLPTITRLLTTPCVKVFWNENYDVPILRDAGIEVVGPIYDGMWAWHLLQSSLPKGLGFVSSFYSNLAPWKHLSTDAPAYYAAMDGVQQLRCMFGIARDLRRTHQWETFLRYVVKLDREVLHPMEQVGLLIDSTQLLDFQSRLKQQESSLYDSIQKIVPESARPLVPQEGWKRFPKGYPKELVVTQDVDVEVLVCDSCGAYDVPAHHLCPETLQ